MAKSNTISLKTDFNPEECLRRLREATDPPKLGLFSPGSYKGSKPIIAKLDGTKIKLWKRRYYRKTFAPFFFGTVSPQAQGSLVEGHFGMDRVAKFFMIFWLAFVLSLLALFALLSSPFRARDLLTTIVPPAIIFGLALPKIGQWMAKTEEKYLREFLATTLAGRPIEPSSLSGRAIENKPL